MSASGWGEKSLGQDGGASEFLFGELFDHGLRGGIVADEHGLDVGTEGRLDGAGAGLVGLDKGGEDTEDIWFKMIGLIEASEEVACAFFKSFAGVDEGADDVEAG